MQSLVDATLARWGRIDVVVCNAATNPTFGPSRTTSDEVFDKVIQTNLHSNLWLCNLALPHMVEQGGGIRCEQIVLDLRQADRRPDEQRLRMGSERFPCRIGALHMLDIEPAFEQLKLAGVKSGRARQQDQAWSGRDHERHFSCVSGWHRS